MSSLTRRSCLLGLSGLALPALLPAPARGDPALREAFLEAARAQIGVTRIYDGAYRRLDYPLGDVPAERGVCTDVLVRAYRAIGIDLQVLVHEDMRADFAAYPPLWGLRAPDRNIDHRRVPNLETFFSRAGARHPIPREEGGWQPGDLVSMRLPGNLPHIAIVGDREGPDGVPLVIHNIGRGTEESVCIGLYPLTGRFRYGLGA
ncbi:MAG: DUF1287 domain-containing protein [Alphaproteobacteria bacterium]|nr:DUF1287 domain-containing protein [Alphaproteobacteria bacterium]